MASRRWSRPTSSTSATRSTTTSRSSPAGKIIWGVPYYGRTWQTTSDALNAPTGAGPSGASKAYYYTGARNLAATYGRRWDDVGKVPWFAYYDSAKAAGSQGYYDDAASLAAKYDMINARGLAGTGMWTLLMDQGDNALWNLIAAKFVNDTTPPSGGIHLLPAISGTASLQVAWTASDAGSGVQSYSVQVRDSAGGGWLPWKTGTRSTGGTYVGVPGHHYEFRVSARDFRGNAQPWLATVPAPRATLAIGGFASVSTSALNVRSGAGVGFSVLDTLPSGSAGRHPGRAGCGGRVPVVPGPVRLHRMAVGPVSEARLGRCRIERRRLPHAGWAPNVTTISAAATPVLPITDLVVPTVASRQPAPNATKVSLLPTITARFSEAVHGVGGGTMIVSMASGSSAVPATISYDPATLTATLRPSARLVPGTTYRVAMSGSIRDVAGNSLPWTTWTFTTISSESFSPARTLLFAPGTYVGWRFNAAGDAYAKKTYTLGSGSAALTTRYAAIPRHPGGWFYISSGVWKGYWTKTGPGIILP